MQDLFHYHQTLIVNYIYNLILMFLKQESMRKNTIYNMVFMKEEDIANRLEINLPKAGMLIACLH
jgi:hypothetical protein